eukprot:1158257-Pelagomonas_calceolata.AAC.5
MSSSCLISCVTQSPGRPASCLSTSTTPTSRCGPGHACLRKPRPVLCLSASTTDFEVHPWACALRKSRRLPVPAQFLQLNAERTYLCRYLAYLSCTRALAGVYQHLRPCGVVLKGRVLLISSMHVVLFVVSFLDRLHPR